MIIISLFVIGQLSAQRTKTDIGERTENWLQSTSSSSNLRSDDGLIGNETPTNTPSIPLGDCSFGYLLCIVAGYVITNKKKRQIN
jgi:hypothetical protein